jgi:hypothetical protein
LHEVGRFAQSWELLSIIYNISHFVDSQGVGPVIGWKRDS